MNGIWDLKADGVEKGDNIRDVTHIIKKTYKDIKGFTHYIFSKTMFKNQRYFIPSNDFKLFQKFIDGGSREYPSDGNIPTDLVASEARIILKEIVKLSKNPNAPYHKEAVAALGNGKFGLVRGTVKLYLGKYTSRDWRRKRFTDDIDFWIYKVDLLEYSLKNNGWVKNKITREWEKLVYWDNPLTLKKEAHVLIASNDINQALDFGGGEYLEGTRLKDIFKKKLKRGHDVDISDIINVAMVFNKAEGFAIDEWYESSEAFEESANTRSTRIVSNLISLVRHSYAIANYLYRLGNVLIKLHDLIFDKILNPESKIVKITKVSVHWQKYLKRHGPDKTRELIHNYIFEQGHIKLYYSKNLQNFAENVLKLLNNKIKHLKVVFEIEKEEFKYFLR
ncbi:hypothetical protein LCGC14_1297710 [marine sediment metagenome]|uniref:Uncharacterized protein n=1 Tax=marine sediment metagenome TaxID=412755 RepID=A0A0F9LB40_9ZZZZ